MFQEWRDKIGVTHKLTNSWSSKQECRIRVNTPKKPLEFFKKYCLALSALRLESHNRFFVASIKGWSWFWSGPTWVVFSSLFSTHVSKQHYFTMTAPVKCLLRFFNKLYLFTVLHLLAFDHKTNVILMMRDHPVFIYIGFLITYIFIAYCLIIHVTM